MTEHNVIRELLPLAVAGALEAAEQGRVEQHLAGCAACAAEFAGWQELAASLKRLPTPQVPAGLLEHTRARIERHLAVESERRWNQAVLVFLVLFAWTVTLVSWPVFRLFSDGVASWLDVQISSAWFVLAAYTGLAWATAGVAAAMLGLRHRRARRMA